MGKWEINGANLFVVTLFSIWVLMFLVFWGENWELRGVNDS